MARSVDGAPVFVEIPIKGTIADLWDRTQRPEQHVRWDLRFTAIEYLPRASEGEPQRFRYETRIGLGIRISGYGKTVGQLEGETSALQFSSMDPKSLIREGTGCWVYRTEVGLIRFRTVYQYEVRLGWFGRLIDRYLFRPLMGWATAWSFDRLRLWIEQSIPPEVSRNMALVHVLARALLGFAWLYHAIVPKLLFPERGELLMTQRSGLFPEHARIILYGMALAEVVLGIAVWCFGRSKWVLGLAGGLLLALMGVVVVTQPDSLTAPMNPLTLNLALVGLAAAAWLSAPYTPSAGRCLRRKDGEHDVDLPAGARQRFR